MLPIPKKAPWQAKAGTSFHNTMIRITPSILKQLFPGCYDENNTGQDKLNISFVLQTSDGDVFTIYDWKLYRPYMEHEMIDFHIGGRNNDITEQAKQEIYNALVVETVYEKRDAVLASAGFQGPIVTDGQSGFRG